jgi:hypothetical protein
MISKCRETGSCRPYFGRFATVPEEMETVQWNVLMDDSLGGRLMNHALVDALQQLNLEPGTYRCELPEHEIVVQVRPRNTRESSRIPTGQSDEGIADPVMIDESCIMLNPWVELPGPSGGIILEARLGKPELPDVPEIPPYIEGEEEGI